jgi:hypothetical protein
MSRASRRNNTITASLFPFLAVLLCTMGVLVVLLVVMASVQLDQAERKYFSKNPSSAPAVDDAEQKALSQALAQMDEAAAEFARGREELLARLRRGEQRLGAMEQDIRRRQEQLTLLRTQVAELKSLDKGATDDLAQAEERLAKQQALLAQTKEEIEKLRAEAAEGTKSYALVPYDGANGTQRQPVYIECLRDKVIFQPEGIELGPADFNEALLSGGPLPSAVRAAQRYYIDQGLSGEKEAYPLVIGRPDASGSFARVLATLTETNMEFGYEVVDADWKLDYSAADPALANEIRRAVENARLKMAQYRERAPGTFVENELTTFSFGPSLLERVRRGQMPSNYTPVGGRAGGGGDAAMMLSRGGIDVGQLAQALESAAAQSSGSPTSGDAMGGSLRGGQPPTGQMAGGGMGSQGNGQGQEGTEPQLDRYAAVDIARKQAEEAAKAGDGTVDPSQMTATEALNGPSLQAAQGAGNGSGQNQSPQGGTGQDKPPSTLAEQAAALAAAKNGEAAQSEKGASQGNASQGAQAQSGQASGASGMSGEPSPYAMPASPRDAPLPGMALVRTIKVRVSPKELVVRSSKSSAADRSISLDTDMRAAATKFVEAVRKEVTDWGIAGDGLYWQPVLEMSVAPGGENLAQQLATALRQSGVEVRLAKLP